MYMATPYSGRNGKFHDSYNFYHSKLRIGINCSFWIFTERWTILQSALPKRYSVENTTLVVSLAKLHNFCIDETDLNIRPLHDCDKENLLVCGSGTVPLQQSI